MEMSSLDAVAVSKGPGSYTGLRIGVAAAKGICFGMDLPMIAVNSLQILSEKYQDSNQAILFPMFDARQNGGLCYGTQRKEGNPKAKLC